MKSGSLLLSASSSDLYLRLFVFLLPRILNNSTMEQGLSGGLSAASPAWVVTNLGNTPLMKSVQIALEFRRDHVSKRTLSETRSYTALVVGPSVGHRIEAPTKCCLGYAGLGSGSTSTFVLRSSGAISAQCSSPQSSSIITSTPSSGDSGEV
jgi:hypothetical protein